MATVCRCDRCGGIVSERDTLLRITDCDGFDYIKDLCEDCKRSFRVWFDSNWSEHVEEGDWDICNWPDDFPEEYMSEVLRLVNEEAPHGCCEWMNMEDQCEP